MKFIYIGAPILAFALVGWEAYIAHMSGAAIPVLDPAGPVALAERSVMFVTAALCAIVVVPVFVFLFWFAWRYRANGPAARREHAPNWDHDSRAAEIVWWLIPSVIIWALAVIAWRSSHALDPYRPLVNTETPLEVEVVALDWKWLFIYPQQNIASVNLLEIPQSVPVHFDLTADAPMNSFWIPALGGQIMVMPGMSTQLNLEASRAGDFSGFSGNISGAGFSGMAFTARAVPQSDFDAWVAQVESASSTPLSLAAYESLAQPSSYNPVSQYAGVQPGLYTSIMQQVSGPENSMGGMTMPGGTMMQ